jgi:sporulation protein YlmC with PRC-barrel domain
MLVKHLLGKEVMDSQGNLAGSVSDMEIDLVTGSVKQILIKSGLFHTYSVKPEDVITAGDRVIIRYLKANIKRIEQPHFLAIKRRVLCHW